MILIYSYLINILFPFIILIIFFRKIIHKEHNKRFKEKLFFSSFNIEKNLKKKLIWFHAASIGELKSIIPLIKKLNEGKKFEFLITTVTLSSANLIQTKLSKEKNIMHRFFPIDKPSLVENFLNCWAPELVIFVDSEIWPNFIFEIKKRKIPLILVNGRITQKTFSKWSLIKSFSEKIFKSFELCLASSNESKKYLERLKAKNVKYLGNLKLTHENILNKSNSDNGIQKDKKYWCALSTHQGEDIFCLNTHLKIKKVHDDVITILIPRHIDRVQSIKSTCDQLNLKNQVLSEGELIKGNNEIIIINSYGFTSNYLNLCKSVFIGKSLLKKFKKVGGQNPIEAARIGCKIYHGPFVYNFQEIYELLNKYNISETIENESELSNKLISDLNKTNETNSEKIEIINGLGKEILENTFKEISNVIR